MGEAMCKKIFAAFVMLLGFHAAAAAQSCSLPALADTVELKPLPGSDLVTVPVAINGKPKQFLLALSANPDEISAAIVSELALPQVDQRKALNAMSEQNSTFQFDAPVFDVRGTSTVRNYQSRVLVAAFTMGGATVPRSGLPGFGRQGHGKIKAL